MEQSQLISTFSKLTSRDKAIALSRITFHLTIAARDIFFCSNYDDSDKVKRAIGISEINHRVTSSVISILKDEPRYPDDVLFNILIEIAEKHELVTYFTTICANTLGKIADANPAAETSV